LMKVSTQGRNRDLQCAFCPCQQVHTTGLCDQD
jgi:hypothetical protein